MSSTTDTEVVTCPAITKGGKGPKCSNPPLKGKKFCGMHKSQETAVAAAPQKQDEKKVVEKKVVEKKQEEKKVEKKQEEKKVVEKKDEEKKEENEVEENEEIKYSLPKENKESKDLCQRQKGKDNKVCSIRAKFQCPESCPKCEGQAFCKRCWDAEHPAAAALAKNATVSADGKVTKTRAIPEDDIRCAHQLKNNRGQCKSKHTAIVNGVKSCGRHGGPKATPGSSNSSRPVSSSKAVSSSNSDIPFAHIWKKRNQFDFCNEDGCGEEHCGEQTSASSCHKKNIALKWLDDYIEITSKSAQTEQTILDQLALLETHADLEIIQFLVDNFGRENVDWLFNNLSRYASTTDTKNGDKISNIWKATAEFYGLKLQEKTDEAEKNVSSSTRSNSGMKTKDILGQYKKKQDTKVDQKVVEKVTSKLQELNQDEESENEEEKALANGEYEENEE